MVTDGREHDARRRGNGSIAPGPLADLRVIDMSTVLAGPNCARYLADFAPT